MVFLPELDAEGWGRLIDATEARSYLPGEVLFEAGESERELLMLTRGSVIGVLGHGNRQSDAVRMSAPAVFGEVAFLDGQPRSLSLTAEDDVEVRVLSWDSFSRLAAYDPELGLAIALDLGRLVAHRLRQTQGASRS